MCPDCHHRFSIHEDDGLEDIFTGKLKCECESLKEIQGGVLILNTEEQKGMNEWERMQKHSKFEEIDAYVADKTPQELHDANSRIMDAISLEIIRKRPKWLVDIATGRGMLMNFLLNNEKVCQSTQNFICTDLSPVILQYDRKKFQKYSKNKNINYISCNAMKLPFEDSHINSIVSFYGYANMGSVLPQALKESFRVLANNSLFLNSVMLIKEDSTGFSKLKDFFLQNNQKGAEKYCLHDPLILFFNTLGFTEFLVKKIHSGIGEKNEVDLLPYENEYYEISLIKGIKK